MTLNKLVRNLAMGAVLYAGCGDGDKTTVNNYSGRDGGAQSQGGGNLREEACERLCVLNDCGGTDIFDGFIGYYSPGFPCQIRCTNLLAECSDSVMEPIINCYDENKESLCNDGSRGIPCSVTMAVPYESGCYDSDYNGCVNESYRHGDTNINEEMCRSRYSL